MSAVQINDVVKRYGALEVVHGINLSIQPQEFVVLVGPSGCGKSTTLRMLAGLEDISDGTVSMDGRVVNKIAPKDRDVAMVFQNYALYPHLSVADNIAFGLRVRGEKRAVIDKAVAEAAQILGLTEYLGRKPAGSFRWPAPTRRHGSCHRAQAENLPVRRTSLEPRRKAAHPHAGRD